MRSARGPVPTMITRRRCASCVSRARTPRNATRATKRHRQEEQRATAESTAPWLCPASGTTAAITVIATVAMRSRRTSSPHRRTRDAS